MNKLFRYNFFLKGFAMGLADIVPGVSGGTIAFVTGIYDTLLKSISSVDKEFVKLILRFKIKHALEHIDYKFLIPLIIGIGSAILLTSRLMHFLLHAFPIETWGFFFGLILASIIYIGKSIRKPLKSSTISQFILGTCIGVLLVSMIPVQSDNNFINIFFSGALAICAMILPGISGSFILVILGKYAFITGALKAPFVDQNILFILVFCMGCLFGLLSFSKLLHYLMNKFHNSMIVILTGFMFGSLKKVWPWKNTLESIVIREKVHVLRESNIMPELNSQTFLVIGLMILGFGLVFSIEYFASKKN